jgi:hypothetical protein
VPVDRAADGLARWAAVVALVAIIGLRIVGRLG